MNSITIVLTVIKVVYIQRLVTAMYENYITNSLECTREIYLNFQVTSESKTKPQCLLCKLQKSIQYHVYCYHDSRKVLSLSQ